MDAFLCCSSADQGLAGALYLGLQAQGLDVWWEDDREPSAPLMTCDRASIIAGSRVMILIWSASASLCREVRAETLTAFHRDRYIIACASDRAKPPAFLKSGSVSRSAWSSDDADAVVRAVREAPDHRNVAPEPSAPRTFDQRDAFTKVTRAQRQELAFLVQRRVEAARTLHSIVGSLVDAAIRSWPNDPDILNIAAQHSKNGYMIAHWDDVQSGRAVADPLLAQAERRFFDTLMVDPTDCTGLDGLASVLMLGHELDAAEIFDEAAVESAARRGFEYPEAQQNLEMIRYYKAKSNRR